MQLITGSRRPVADGESAAGRCCNDVHRFLVFVSVAVLTVIAAGCASSRCDRRVRDVLTLEIISAPREAVAGAAVQLRFVLRNVGPDSLDICVPSGVSTMIENQSGSRRPLTQYGPTTGPHCVKRLRLASNQATAWPEQIWIRKDSSPGPNLIEGTMYVKLLRPSPCLESDGILRTTSPLTIIAALEE